MYSLTCLTCIVVAIVRATVKRVKVLRKRVNHGLSLCQTAVRRHTTAAGASPWQAVIPTFDAVCDSFTGIGTGAHVIMVAPIRLSWSCLAWSC
jgi:hypothetical protein